jgi:hypothetical protein
MFSTQNECHYIEKERGKNFATGTTEKKIAKKANSIYIKYQYHTKY